MELHAAAEWAALAAAVTVVLTAVLGVTIRLGRRHIYVTTSEVLREELDKQMGPMRLELRTMNGEMGRVRILESKLENGLMARQERLEEKVDAITTHLMGD